MRETEKKYLNGYIIIDDTNSLEVYELLMIATRVYLYCVIENHENEQ